MPATETVAAVSGAGLVAAGLVARGPAAPLFSVAGVGLLGFAAFRLLRPGSGLLEKVFEPFDPGPPLQTMTPAADPGAGGGFLLGKPRNVYRVSGIIRQPLEGARVRDNFVVDAAIENQNSQALGGSVTFQLTSAAGQVESAPVFVFLDPGEFLEISTRAGAATGTLFIGEATLRMRFEGFTLDRVELNVRTSPGVAFPVTL